MRGGRRNAGSGMGGMKFSTADSVCPWDQDGGPHAQLLSQQPIRLRYSFRFSVRSVPCESSLKLDSHGTERAESGKTELTEKPVEGVAESPRAFTWSGIRGGRNRRNHNLPPEAYLI